MNQRRRDVLRGIGIGTLATIGGAETATALSTTPGTGGDAGPARVRVAHASPDAPAVDVFVAGDKVLSGVSFRSVTEYLTVPAGDYEVTITAAGDPDTVAFEGEVTVEADTDYTVAAIGELSEGTFRPKVLEDANLDISDSLAIVRVVHASPDAPAVDVTAYDGQYTVFHGVEFGEQTRYLALLAGEQTVGIEATETGEQVAEATLELAGGTTYTLFAEGYLTPDDEPTDEAFGVVPATSGPRTPKNARVRVAHLSPDAPDVDVRVDGDRVVSGLSFRSVTDYLTVPAGDRMVAITPAGDPDTVVFEGSVPVEAGSDYTIAAIGELSEETFRPTVLQDPDSVDRGRAKLRVVHASPDAPAVDVTVDDAAATIVDGLAFGDATDFLEARPGEYELEVRPDTESNDNPFDAEFDVRLRPGTVYTAFAAGYFTADDEPENERFGLVLADGEPRG